MADPQSSYGNDVTNIVKLHELYEATDVPLGESLQKLAQLKVYIEGIGTQSGQPDSTLGLGTGRGESGVAARVNKAFAQIQIEINTLIRENPDCEITSLVFDTFGFSRGAAAARHFANEVVRCNHGALNVIVRSNSGGYGRHFANRFGSDVHMGFIGLFDTVASVAGSRIWAISRPVR